MNYCTYFKSTGQLHSATPVPEETDDIDYMEISIAEMNDFLSGVKSLHQYVVVPDLLEKHKGTLVSREELNTKWTGIDDVIYAIPSITNADFTVLQNAIDKTCSIKLSKFGQMQLGNINNIKQITLAACKPSDPHLPMWIWNINLQDLFDKDVIINYTGQDDIQFYTKRIFKTYSHEQL